jgi:hypothetical protein
VDRFYKEHLNKGIGNRLKKSAKSVVLRFYSLARKPFRFFVRIAYPELKADTQFLNLQGELSNIEDAIQNSRRYYNAIVRDYNAKLRSFPDVLISQN